MATPKLRPADTFLADLNEDMEKTWGPVIEERWFVSEYWTADKLGRERSWEWKAKQCSPYYATKEECEDFIRTHDPAPGAVFLVNHEGKQQYLIPEYRWFALKV